MAEAATVVVAAEVSTAAAALVAGDFMAVADFPAVATMVAPTAVITVADTAMVEAAVLTATAEDPATRAVVVPMEECVAQPAPTIHGHPKVKAFATHPPAGILLNPAAPTQVVG